jgi:hypothetical protein
MCTETFTTLEYYPVKDYHITEIDVLLLDQDGKLVPFTTGRVILTLDIQRM